MKEHDIEGELSLGEVKKRITTSQIHERVKEIRKVCTAVFEDPENRTDETLKQGNRMYLRDSQERVCEYLQEISRDLTQRLSQDSEFNTLRSETLLNAADISICSFMFRDAYAILSEAIPLLDENISKKMHAHLTSAHCAAYSPHWYIPLFRQMEKIRLHIKETLLLSQDATESDQFNAVMGLLWITPFRKSDIQHAHIAAQKEMAHEFAIPELIEKVLIEGRV